MSDHVGANARREKRLKSKPKAADHGLTSILRQKKCAFCDSTPFRSAWMRRILNGTHLK